uniref:Uncharacterized protein n=1 Tax=Sander lucioperca TaxID=283035 RepID=A0A8C9XLG0_SANLU
IQVGKNDCTVKTHLFSPAANISRSEDQFLCSICLDVFNEPVSTPCYWFGTCTPVSWVVVLCLTHPPPQPTSLHTPL